MATKAQARNTVDFSKPVKISSLAGYILSYVADSPNATADDIVRAVWNSERHTLASFKQRIHDMRYRGYLVGIGGQGRENTYYLSEQCRKAYDAGMIGLTKEKDPYPNPGNTKKSKPKTEEKEPAAPAQQFEGAADAAMDAFAAVIRDNHNMKDALTRIQQILDELKQQQ